MDKLKQLVLAGLVFLFPLFFLSITQEYYLTNKVYLFAYGGLLLLLLSTLQVFATKKISWKKSAFDLPVVLLLVTVGLSIVIASPNKIDGLVNLYFGFVSFFALALFYFHFVQEEDKYNALSLLNYSALVVSVLTIFFFFQPFKNIALPQNLSFLKSPTFSSLGTTLDLAMFLGFVFVVQAAAFVAQRKHQSSRSPRQLAMQFVNAVALILVLYLIFKPQAQNSFLLPPIRLSWYAAVETLKNPVTALFGVGIDNYASIFSRVKDLSYNQTPFWQISSFNVARSGLLHLFTTMGIFGLVAFVILIWTALKSLLDRAKQNDSDMVLLAGFLYALTVFVLFPPSFVVLFLLFFVVSLLARDLLKHHQASKLDLGSLTPLFVAAVLLGLAFVGGSAYFLSRSYVGEYYFKKSLDGLVQNNARKLYDNQRLAIQNNPYIERYRVSFSQTNLLLANSIARQAQQKSEDPKKPVQLSDQEKQTITQAVQAAINEAKAAVVLNQNKSTNWENLAAIYRSIINIAKQADVFTISAYQRAINADPNNPIYWLNLGGVYYALGNYNEAVNQFQVTTRLKPDWPNAYYNLAWGNYQKQDYERAVSSMETVLKLLANNKDSQDYKKAQSELETFKKKLPEQKEATGTGQLQLPQKPEPELSPKIELPKSASPEAN